MALALGRSGSRRLLFPGEVDMEGGIGSMDAHARLSSQAARQRPDRGWAKKIRLLFLPPDIGKCLVEVKAWGG